jgi:hypothetical protein
VIKKSDIVTNLKKKFGEKNVIEVSTRDFDLTTNPKNQVKSRCDWADKNVIQLYNKERKNIKKNGRGNSKGEYCFSYIKLATDGKESYGMVSGKSCFHKNYASDVWFYDKRKKGSHKVLEFMEKNNLVWDKNSIIIIKNDNPNDAQEAYKKEKEIKKIFNLFG